MNVFVRRNGWAAAALAVSLLTSSASAQATLSARTVDLPDAKVLIAKYNKAVGGDVWKSHKSARMKATFEVAAQGMRADMEAMNIFATKNYMMKMEIPGMGQMMMGYDGTTGWSRDPVSGARLLAGAEAAQAAEEADPEATLRTSPNIVKSETVEKTNMNNQDCYKVTHTWKSGRVSHDCFAVESGLIVASIQKQASPMGEMEATQLLDDYKDFGGVKRATVSRVQVMGTEIKTTINSFEWDTVKPEDLEPPADIKALLKKG